MQTDQSGEKVDGSSTDQGAAQAAPENQQNNDPEKQVEVSVTLAWLWCVMYFQFVSPAACSPWPVSFTLSTLHRVTYVLDACSYFLST